MKIKPTALVILDGVGYSKGKKYNAVYLAKMPNFKSYPKSYPNTLLKSSGKTAGLLPGFMGNSEVGHLTIGAGRTIEQPMTFITKAIEDGSFFTNKALGHLKKLKGNLHIMGLLSDAGVHSLEKHLYAFLKAAKENGVKKVFIHPFLDGRDTLPESASKYLTRLDKVIKKVGLGEIGSIHGRFYAMDRDKNWDRTKKSYEVLTSKQKETYKNWKDILEKYYKEGTTDEFIPPSQINPNAIVKDKDGIIFFNFRPDRAIQITALLTKKPLSFFMTPVEYSPKTIFMFKKKPIKNTLKEVLCKKGETIFSIAETEKYAHVTYFFNGGKEEKLPCETRVLIHSIPAKTYIKHPNMKAHEITEEVLKSLRKNPANFYLINYANGDMVGHSGNLKATVKAMECLDKELKKLFEQIVLKMDGTLYITADHGNAEEMYDPKTKQPLTQHTTNPVYFIMIRKDLKGFNQKLKIKGLSDIAPFILKNMKIPIPKEMV